MTTSEDAFFLRSCTRANENLGETDENFDKQSDENLDRKSDENFEREKSYKNFTENLINTLMETGELDQNVNTKSNRLFRT